MNNPTVLIHKAQGLEDRYTILSNEALQRPDLSYETLGLLTYILSLPTDWSLRIAKLQRPGFAGRDKIRRMLGELVEAGYIHIEKKLTEKGKFAENIYHVYAEPDDNPSFTENQSPVNTRKPFTENPPLQSKDSNKVNKQTKIGTPDPRKKCVLLIAQMMCGGHRAVEPTKQMFGHAAKILGGLQELTPPPDDKELDAIFEWHARVHSTMNFPRNIPAFQQIILHYRAQNPVLAEPEEARHTENSDTSLDKYLDKFLTSREDENNDAS